MKLSVIICTHNPDYVNLSRAISSVYNQLNHQIELDCMVVDNASNEDVSIEKLNISDDTLRVIKEDKLGLTYARICGINNSCGDYLLFLDDDNELDRFYVSRIVDISVKYPQLGCFGAGIISPVYEKEPEHVLCPYIGSLAIRDEKKSVISDDFHDSYYPYGAGLVVRRDVALAYVVDVQNSDLKLSLDRKGGSLNSCGDDHFSWIAIRLGCFKGVFTELSLKHYIPANRVQKKYLLKMAESYGYSRSLLFYVNGFDFPGLKEIKENERLSEGVSRLHMIIYKIKSSVLKLISKNTTSIEDEFKSARSKGVLRFYRQVYLKSRLYSN